MVAFDIVDIVEKQPHYGATLVANRPEILAQVVYAAEKELASTLCDIFVRRTQLFFRDMNQGLDCVDVVADIMAKLLQWSPDRTQQEKDLYREEVQRSRRWQNH
jgi:glycerol-3-phosphate dehydrogenase